jgi:hypothetical protein
MKLNLKAQIGDLKYIVLATIIQVFVDTSSLKVCLDSERISVRITLFGLVVEHSLRLNDISENIRRLLIFTIPG